MKRSTMYMGAGVLAGVAALTASNLEGVTMNTEKQSSPIATALAAAIMMVMPLTIGYYLVRAGFGALDFPPIYVFFGGFLIAVGGSALLAWVAYKLIIRWVAAK